MTNGDCEATPGSFASFPEKPLIVLEAIRNSDKTADNVTAGILVMETTDRS